MFNSKKVANNYEVYEDNGGGLYLCILGTDGQCKRIFEGWEYGPAGILADALAELQEDPTIYDAWDGDLVDRWTDDGIDTSAQRLYDDGLGDLIADSTGYISPYMGYAGAKALNVDRSDDD